MFFSYWFQIPILLWMKNNDYLSHWTTLFSGVVIFISIFLTAYYNRKNQNIKIEEDRKLEELKEIKPVCAEFFSNLRRYVRLTGTIAKMMDFILGHYLKSGNIPKEELEALKEFNKSFDQVSIDFHTAINELNFIVFTSSGLNDEDHIITAITEIIAEACSKNESLKVVDFIYYMNGDLKNIPSSFITHSSQTCSHVSDWCRTFIMNKYVSLIKEVTVMIKNKR
jgi:hypothetical protein